MTEEWTLRLADLDGVERDLTFVADACNALLKRLQENDHDLTVLESLQSAAMVKYGRCFKEGIRKAFRIPDNWIADLEDNLQEIHRDTLTLRDKHIAHAVNDWDNHVPEIFAVRESPDAAPIAVAAWIAYSGTLGLSPDWIRGLRDVALVLRLRIESEKQAEEVRVVSKFNELPATTVSGDLRKTTERFPRKEGFTVRVDGRNCGYTPIAAEFCVATRQGVPNSRTPN